MPKRFKITEQQYNQMLDEGVSINGVTDASGKADINKTAQSMAASGIDPKDVTVSFSGSAMSGGTGDTTLTEGNKKSHRLITKKELKENRLRYLKENSEIISFNNFMKSLH
jgi:predicted amino acid dehydrogenase